jgi:hypothetical protein
MASLMPSSFLTTPSPTPTAASHHATAPNPTSPTPPPNSNQQRKSPEAEWLWDSFGDWTSYEEGNANNFWATRHSQFPQIIKNDTLRR